MSDTVYLRGNMPLTFFQSTYTVDSGEDYDGVASFNALTSIDIDGVNIYVGDFSNDDINIEKGSLDKFYRRIYAI